MSIRRLLPLLLLLLFSLTLMTYQSNKGIIAPLRFLGSPLSSINGMLRNLSDSLKSPFRKIMLRDEDNRRLRAEVQRLEAERQKDRDLLYENRRLRELLDLREKEKRFVAAARVVSRGPDRWSNVRVIDKGTRDGIAKDMAVVTPAGLVGKVALVSDSSAYVLLLTDINFSASVRIQETRKEVILSGTGGTRCALKYVLQGEDIKKGGVVVTSGLDELFPREVPVGFVSKVSKKSTSIFQEIEVTPFQDPAKLDEVAVIRR